MLLDGRLISASEMRIHLNLPECSRALNTSVEMAILSLLVG
jgi:hypothetical protein